MPYPSQTSACAIDALGSSCNRFAEETETYNGRTARVGGNGKLRRTTFICTQLRQPSRLRRDNAFFQQRSTSRRNHLRRLLLPVIPLCRCRHNFAKKSLRRSVIVRKLSQGSKSEVAAQLMSVMVSVFATLRLHGISEYDWLMDYLGTCAAGGGKAPEDVSAWLPWEMDATRLAQFQSGFTSRPQAP